MPTHEVSRLSEKYFFNEVAKRGYSVLGVWCQILTLVAKGQSGMAKGQILIGLGDRPTEVELALGALTEMGKISTIQVDSKRLITVIGWGKPKPKPIVAYNQSSSALEAIYAAYPRKEGKHKGMLALAREVQSEDDYNAVLRAVLNYKAKIRREGTEKAYIKHFSTFMNCWRDYLALPPPSLTPTPTEPTWVDVVKEIKDVSA